MSQVDLPARPGAVLGWIGFFAGAAALLMALMVFWSGPLLVPEPVAEPTLAERATEAARSLIGPAPEPEPVLAEPGIDLYALATFGVAGLGGLAIILGLAGMARGEPPRPSISAVSLGGGAVIFQLLTGFILILVCLMLVGTAARGGETVGEVLGGILEAIMGVFTAIGEFFSNLFGGLFGG